LVVPGVDLALAAAPYEGVGRGIVAGLKFAGRLQLAMPMAFKLAALLETVGEAAIVPVPPAPVRSRRRGFDPAAELAAGLARITRRELRACLIRAEGPRQVGRPRALRLADPPRVRLAGEPPDRALIVDDVVTTGATLAACARALRDGGGQGVAAVAFARSRPS
jgi:predicted amidophosphoribosyltransferase